MDIWSEGWTAGCVAPLVPCPTTLHVLHEGKLVQFAHHVFSGHWNLDEVYFFFEQCFGPRDMDGPREQVWHCIKNWAGDARWLTMQGTPPLMCHTRPEQTNLHQAMAGMAGGVHIVFDGTLRRRKKFCVYPCLGSLQRWASSERLQIKDGAEWLEGIEAVDWRIELMMDLLK